MRDELGIEPGDEVTFWRDDDHVHCARHTAPPLRGRFQSAGLMMSSPPNVAPIGDEAVTVVLDSWVIIRYLEDAGPLQAQSQTCSTRNVRSSAGSTSARCSTSFGALPERMLRSARCGTYRT